MPPNDNAAKPFRAASRTESGADMPRVADGIAGERLHERIRHRAFELFLARCGGPGDPLSDWLEAERQVRSAEFRRGRDDVKAAERGEALLAGESD
jgi:hypothetical protein